MRKVNPGVTLIELLIVIVLLSVVSMAVYATFNNGIKIWQKLNTPVEGEDLGIFFDKFTRDLANGFKFSAIPFSGREDTFQLATLVNSPRLGRNTVGEVVYYYDRGSKTLNRKELDFSQVYKGEEPASNQQLSNVKSLNFQYYYYDKEKKEYSWHGEWSKEALPVAVKVELEINYGKENIKVTKTAPIPVGS